MKNIICRLLLLVTLSGTAQELKRDSLFSVLKKNQPDTSRILTLIEISRYYQVVSPDSGLRFANEAMRIAKKLNWVRGMAHAAQSQGLLYYRKSELDSAMQCSEAALDLLGPKADPFLRARIIGNIGLIYWNRAEYPHALQALLEENKFYLTGNYAKYLATNLGNIANVYAGQGDMKKAGEYYAKALSIHDSLRQWNDYAVLCGNIGFNYIKLVLQEKDPYGQDSLLNKAEEWIGRSLDLAKEHNNVQTQARQLGNMGIIYTLKKNIPGAIDCYTRSIQLKKELNDQIGIANTLGNIAATYVQVNDYPKATDYFKQSLELAVRIHDANDALFAYKSLSEIYTKTGKWKEAYQNQEHYFALRDSIFNAKKSKEIGRLEAKAEFEKQQLLSDLQHKKELEIAAEKEKQQEIISLSVGAGFVLILIFMTVLFGRLKKIRQQKALIETQKELVELRNREVTDSLNYASRIQRSLLPSEHGLSLMIKRSQI